MKTTLGGDRLGSGNKQQIQMRNYERSTHDLGYTWRSTTAPGTLVPFMVEVGLPGDTFDIDLDTVVMTHPTIGPLFGSFKIQLDVFQCPIRLYNGKLHMNKLGIGMEMSKIKLPQIEMYANTNVDYIKTDNQQINPSSIYSYLNMRGIGINKSTSRTENQTNYRRFNAVPYLAYWDIYKNYYANKQEEIGYVIHNPMVTSTNNVIETRLKTEGSAAVILPNAPATASYTVTTSTFLRIAFETSEEPDINDIRILVGESNYKPAVIFDKIDWYSDGDQDNYLLCKMPRTLVWGNKAWSFNGYGGQTVNSLLQAPKIKDFPLQNIDDMREAILQATGLTTPFIINSQSEMPYGLGLGLGNATMPQGMNAFCKLSSMEGLAVKTYQSDLFNNWISTEWIDGTNGINEITSIDTTGGSFNIDTLNLANKVYNMLNRIAMSGGTYDDWLDAVYTHERMKSQESPAYMGGLIKELAFEEVISNAGTETDPLGTLAGRGQMTNKKKGGNIRIKINEPSYIMGIVSLTPRLDYSQGNKWDVNLKTMDDLHKPALDEIGFQDLITDQMAWWDTELNASDEPVFKSAGKQPAWINYMTNVNQTRGNFADRTNQMWMTLNRRYENDNGSIKDLTTYIDPMKYNHIFADTSFDAQNFWIQIKNDITARRKMSAKVIPNL